MPGPEARIERKCVQLAKEEGWTVYKIRFLNQRGCPDRLFARWGRVVFVEFKAPGKKLSPLQGFAFYDLQCRAGLEVWVVDSVEEFRRLMGWPGGSSFKTDDADQ